MNRFTLIVPAVLVVAGCAETRTGVYPSLLPRATETQGFDEPAPVAAAPAAADPVLDARITELATLIAQKRATFATAAMIAKNRTIAARGATAGSEPWLDAQAALGDLDVLRADAGEPLSTLEQIALDRAVDLAPTYPKLDEALTAARSATAEMSNQIAAIQADIARQDRIMKDFADQA